jgi:DtxR family Mn-dependent transcriptional regulator
VAADAGCVGDNGQVSDLIDTTEMYLRTIYELTEEGILPMRARITERLGQSGPTVSQTVARMQRDGLVELDEADRHLVLTEVGSELATRVMRKHRLAERLLVDVIGMPWAQVHPEACRWEHVMSESVERRLLEILGHPTTSPFGNPIPGLAALAGSPATTAVDVAATGQPLAIVVTEKPRTVSIVLIAEILQADEDTMGALDQAGAVPGQSVEVVRVGDRVSIGGAGGTVELTGVQSGRIVVAA